MADHEKSPLLDSGHFSKSSGLFSKSTEERTRTKNTDLKRLTKSTEESNLREQILINSGIYTPYIRSTSRTHVIEEEPSGCHRPRIIEPVVLLFYLAYNCTTPIQEQFVTKLVRDYYHTNVYTDLVGNAGVDVDLDAVSGQTCVDQIGNETNAVDVLLEDLIQSQASLWLLYIKLASSVPAMLATLIICSYGDIGGRKLGILLPPAGCALKSILFIMAMYIQGSPFYLLFIASFIEGMFGSHLTFMGSSYAYMADCTPNSKRPLRYTILQCANVIAGLAHIPFGYWIDASGFLNPFWFVTGVHIFTFLYILILIPESHPPPENLDEDEKVDHAIGGMFSRAGRAFLIYTNAKHKSRRNQIALILLLCSFNCRVLFEMGKSAVETLFMLAAPLCLSSTVIGYFNALNAFAHGVFGLIGTALFLRCFTENTTCIIFTLSIVASRLVFAYASTVWILFLGMVMVKLS